MSGLSVGNPFYLKVPICVLLFLYLLRINADDTTPGEPRQSAASGIFAQRMGEASDRAQSFASTAAQWVALAGDAVRHRITEMEERARDQPQAREPASKQDLVARFWQHLNRTYATPPGETTERNFANLFAAHMKLVRLLERKGLLDAGEAESVRPKQLCSIIEEHRSLFAPCATERATPESSREHEQAHASTTTASLCTDYDLEVTDGHE